MTSIELSPYIYLVLFVAALSYWTLGLQIVLGIAVLISWSAAFVKARAQRKVLAAIKEQWESEQAGTTAARKSGIGLTTDE